MKQHYYCASVSRAPEAYSSHRVCVCVCVFVTLLCQFLNKVRVENFYTNTMRCAIVLVYIACYATALVYTNKYTRGGLSCTVAYIYIPAAANVYIVVSQDVVCL